VPRLTVLGGSSVSSAGLALALRPLAERSGLTLVLQGRSAGKLESVGRGCRAALAGTSGTVEWHTDLEAALDGAALVLVQVRVGGLAGRRFDESFPRRLGLLGEETLGAGGFSNALRTVPVVLDLARAIEAFAPDARVVNLTNPASIVQQAIARYTPLSVISVCDVPVTVAGWLSQLLGVPGDELEMDFYGSNHLGWATGARDAGGRDRLPEALGRLEQLEDFPLPAGWARALGVLPGPYLRHLYAADRQAAPPEGPVRADQLLDVESQLLDAYAALGPDADRLDVEAIVARRAPHWYQEIVVPVLEALISDAPRRLVVQVPNGDRDERLPAGQALELPARVSSAGVVTEAPPILPADCRVLLEQNAVYEQLAVEAIVESDRAKALRALVANPLVGAVDQAEAVLEAVWPRPVDPNPQGAR
jgi:6-phospho-beta-glucosidase